MTTLVQSAFVSGYGGTGAGFTLALTGAATTSNAICVTIVTNNSASVVSVKTSTGQDLTLDKAAETNQPGSQKILFYSVVGVTGTPTGVVLKMTTDESVYAWLEEVSGMATSSIVDVDPAKATGGTNTTPTISVTTTTANAYIRYLSSYGSGETFTPGSGYTAAYTASFNRHGQFNVDVGAAGTKSVTATIGAANDWAVSAIAYKTGATGPTVTTVSSANNTEASTIVHTVTLSGATSGSTNFAASLSDVTATGGGTDYTSALGSATYSNGVTFSGGNMVVPTAVSSWTVTISTATDALDEVNETYTLTVGGVSGTGTINDDDAQPSVTISDATEVAGTVTFVATLSAASGKTITFVADTANGTKTAGVDYTALTGSTVTFNPGETTKNIVVTAL